MKILIFGPFTVSHVERQLHEQSVIATVVCKESLP